MVIYKQIKDIECFSLKTRVSGKRRERCAVCLAGIQKKYYQDHKPNYKIQRKESRRKLRIKIFDFLSCHPCVDCGEKDPVVLDFDHVRGNKEENISRLIREIRPWELILSEIEKCEIRCANCHRRKTAKQFNWFCSKPFWNESQ